MGEFVIPKDRQKSLLERRSCITDVVPSSEAYEQNNIRAKMASSNRFINVEPWLTIEVERQQKQKEIRTKGHRVNL